MRGNRPIDNQYLDSRRPARVAESQSRHPLNIARAVKSLADPYSESPSRRLVGAGRRDWKSQFQRLPQ